MTSVTILEAGNKVSRIEWNNARLRLYCSAAECRVKSLIIGICLSFYCFSHWTLLFPLSLPLYLCVLGIERSPPPHPSWTTQQRFYTAPGSAYSQSPHYPVSFEICQINSLETQATSLESQRRLTFTSTWLEFYIGLLNLVEWIALLR